MTMCSGILHIYAIQELDEQNSTYKTYCKKTDKD